MDNRMLSFEGREFIFDFVVLKQIFVLVGITLDSNSTKPFKFVIFPGAEDGILAKHHYSFSIFLAAHKRAREVVSIVLKLVLSTLRLSVDQFTDKIRPITVN